MSFLFVVFILYDSFGFRLEMLLLKLKKPHSKTLFHTFSSQSMLPSEEPKSHSIHRITHQFIHQSKPQPVEPREIEHRWPDQDRTPKTKIKIGSRSKSKAGSRWPRRSSIDAQETPGHDGHWKPSIGALKNWVSTLQKDRVSMANKDRVSILQKTEYRHSRKTGSRYSRNTEFRCQSKTGIG